MTTVVQNQFNNTVEGHYEVINESTFIKYILKLVKLNLKSIISFMHRKCSVLITKYCIDSKVNKIIKH